LLLDLTVVAVATTVVFAILPFRFLCHLLEIRH
jgi:hypothetical protein